MSRVCVQEILCCVLMFEVSPAPVERDGAQTNQAKRWWLNGGSPFW